MLNMVTSSCTLFWKAFSSVGKITLEINQSIASAGKLYHAMNEKFILDKWNCKGNKNNSFQITYEPILTYVSKTWTHKLSHLSGYTEPGKWYLRRVEEQILRDRIRNATIADISTQREEMNHMGQFNVQGWLGDSGIACNQKS